MKRGFLSTACMMALWMGGCPNRHSGTRLVYVPAPPPSAAPTAGELVIQEPPPPPPSEPALGVPSEVPGQVEILPRPAPRRRTDSAVPTDAPASSEQPATEVPMLKPRETEEGQDALRREVVARQQDIQQRLTRLEGRVTASAADRKAREDARAFLDQSKQAMEDGDVQRALNLARKASLFLAALEP